MSSMQLQDQPSDERSLFLPWQTGLQGYLDVAKHIHDSEGALSSYGTEVYNYVLAALDLNEQQLVELDARTDSSIAKEVVDDIHAFRDHLLTALSLTRGEQVHRGHEAHSAMLLPILQSAFDAFDVHFSRSMIFMPHNKFVSHLSSIQDKPEVLHHPETQSLLAAISATRREAWRAMEHFVSLAHSPEGYGVIHPQGNLHAIVLKAIETEKRRLKMEYRFTDIVVHDTNIPNVAVDHPRLFNAFRELVRNAVFSTLHWSRDQRIEGALRRSAEVNIRMTNEDPAKIIVEIEDNGVGMTEEQVSRIADYGYSRHGESTRFGGRGVGASISNLTLMEHSGQLSYESDTAQGTTAKLSFPVYTFLSPKPASFSSKKTT